MSIRALIVDDEPLARARLIDLLSAESDVDVLGECRDGPEAIERIRQLDPDLVFLDVQMPDADAFEVLSALGTEGAPLVIFVTAHEQHAVKAFDVNAVDYLVKPFERERFRHALDRVRAYIDQKARGDVGTRVLELASRLRPAQTDRVMVKSRGRLFFWRVDSIDWIEAEGNYVRFHVGFESHVLRETMTSLEARLDPSRFMRIHRSRIVNVERIRKIESRESGDYIVTLGNGVTLTMGRSYRSKLCERFGGL